MMVGTCETEAGCSLTMRSRTPVEQKLQVRVVICQFASFCVLDNSERGVIATVSSPSQAFLFFVCKALLPQETSYLPFVPKTRGTFSQQLREAGGWGRCGVPRCLGPGQDPPRDPSVQGTQSQSQSQGRSGAQPSGPPSPPQHLLTGHQQSHKKSYKTFSLMFPGPEIPSQTMGVPGARDQQGPPV